MLGKWVDAYARERGLAAKRVRDWVSYMVLAGRLEQANAESARATFTIKGAVALEMRLPENARATKDIDVIAEADGERDLPQVLEGALAHTYQDFVQDNRTGPSSADSPSIHHLRPSHPPAA